MDSLPSVFLSHDDFSMPSLMRYFSYYNFFNWHDSNPKSEIWGALSDFVNFRIVIDNGKIK